MDSWFVHCRSGSRPCVRYHHGRDAQARSWGTLRGMRVFITGATGYIGNSVALNLHRRGHDVVGLARSDSAKEKLLGQGLHPVMGDLESLDVLREMVADADAVV